jgi:type VI secretion system secreted protein Hcp
MPNMFLKFHDIDGESLDDKHPQEIEIVQWGWGADATIKWEQNQGGQCTHSAYHQIDITKTVDKASLVLQRCCLTGKHIRHAKITCRKNDGDQKIEYLILELKNVMIQEVVWAGDGAEGATKETVKLEFAEFEMKYKLQQDEGTASGATTFSFNVQTQIGH